MGEPKASLDLAGLPLAGWAGAALAQVTGELVQVGGEPIADLGWPVWPDRRPDAGPAAGLEAALLGARSAVIVCAVDTPFVPPGLLRAALRAVRHGAMAAVPRWRGRWHPLCGAYAPDTLPFLTARLDARQVDLQSLLESVAVWPLGGAALRGFGQPDTMLLNVNSPADLQRARLSAKLAEAPGLSEHLRQQVHAGKGPESAL
jgi:molybdopterin-guanine dinucleotide biosynthesis protein A